MKRKAFLPFPGSQKILEQFKYALSIPSYHVRSMFDWLIGLQVVFKAKSIIYPPGKRARLHWFYMWPDDSYIKLAPSGSTTHNFLLCMLPAPKCSCTTELMCMTELKKCSIHNVMFCTLLPLDLSYNSLFIESLSINSSQSNRNLPRVGG